MRKSNIEKMRRNNQTVWDVVTERDSKHARLLNYSTSHKVEIFWGMNENMVADRMFVIKVGDNEAILNAEEMRRFLRWV